MPSLGMAEIIVIVILALVLLGPDKLPKAARSVGKALNELRRHSDRVKDEFRDVVDFDDITSVHRDLTSMRDDFRSTLTSAGTSLVSAGDVPSDAPPPVDDDAAVAAPVTAPTAPQAVAPVVVDADEVHAGPTGDPPSRRLPGTDTGPAQEAGEERDADVDTTTTVAILEAATLVEDRPTRRIPGVVGDGDA